MNCPASARFGKHRPKVQARTLSTPVSAAIPVTPGHATMGWRILLCTLVLAAFGSACVPNERPADLTIINGAEPESLDPAIVTGIPEMRITKALFEGLTRLDAESARPAPGLAQRWDVSPDGLTYTFHLRSNLLWSTGKPITAEDVAWSWIRALAPSTASDYAGQLFCIRGAEDFNVGRVGDPSALGFRVVDASTLEVRLNQPAAYFLDLCAMPVAAVVPRDAIQQHGDRWLHARPLPVSGPFLLDSWRVNSKVRLVRNPLYWDAANTASEVIDLLPIGSPNTALNLYETGAADIVWDKDLVPAELLDVLLKRPDFHGFEFLGTYFFRFNVTRPPFTDARVRRALALATNKERLVRKLLTGGEQPARHFVPASTANYARIEGMGYDPEEGRRLLAEAGFPDGKGFPPVQYAFAAAAGGAARMHGKIAIELQQMWREELGISVELRQVERKIFYSAQSRLEFDLSGSSWVADYNDPNTFLDLFTSTSGNNRTGWKHGKYDDLIRLANSQTDSAERARIFQEAEELLVSVEAPIVPLYFFAGFNAFDPSRIKGIHQNPLDEHPLQNISNVRYTHPQR